MAEQETVAQQQQLQDCSSSHTLISTPHSSPSLPAQPDTLSPQQPSCCPKVARYRNPIFPFSPPKSLNSYLLHDVRDDALIEIELLLCAFATGIQDATTYPDYMCFASNQTGNTVLLAVTAAGIGPATGTLAAIENTIMSLCMFVFGAYVFGQVGNYFGPRKRWWLLLSNLLQTAMVFAATAVQYVYPIHHTGTHALITIALLAFSSGGQVAMSRRLGITEITTAMATAAYVDLVVDPKLMKWRNRPRNRRFLFLSTLIAGSFAGAFAYKELGSAFVLLLSAIGKVVVLGLFFVNPSMEEMEEHKC